MIAVPEPVLAVCRGLRAAGYEAWCVGGAVRDSLLGRTPSDWDIATSARPADVVPLFERVEMTGLQHGTVTVVLNGTGYEVTTFRWDGEYSDGRRPDSVAFVDSIDEDLARRDFTMNAVAYDPLREVFADPFLGRSDIERRNIRCVGNPYKRFSEDGLRVLRAARFAATLEFNVATDTLAAIPLSLDAYAKVAIERVTTEWQKALLAPKPSAAFEIMQATGMLDVFVPEMAPMVGCSQNRYHEFDVWGHTMRVLDATPAEPVLRLAGLFHDISKPATKGVNEKTGDITFYDHEEVGAGVTDAILERMRFSNEDRESAVRLVRHHLIPYQPGWAASAIRRWVRRVGAENVAPLCALGRADIAGKGKAATEMRSEALDDLERRIANMTISAPIVTSTNALAISGRDVMVALAIGPGPRVGAVLRELLEAVTDDPELNTRERLLERIGQPQNETSPHAEAQGP